ncbi:MAG: Mut7-C RNAse domain-containing protein [Verrucomicrobiota bacterium]
MNPNEVRFAADAMLLSLAKWLRMLGYDCLAGSGIFGRSLVETAVAERRWILTRNRRYAGDLPQLLLERADIFLLAGEELPGQLREVADRFSLEPSAFLFTRCLVCNAPLHPIAKPHLPPSVPHAVRAREEHFWQCRHCRRIYWRGSHVRNSMRRLNDWLGNP